MDIRKIVILTNPHNHGRMFVDAKAKTKIHCAFENKVCSPDCAACYDDEACTDTQPFRPYVAAHCSRVQKGFQTRGEVSE